MGTPNCNRVFMTVFKDSGVPENKLEVNFITIEVTRYSWNGRQNLEYQDNYKNGKQIQLN